MFQHPPPLKNVDPAIVELLDDSIDKWIRQTAQYKKISNESLHQDVTLPQSSDVDVGGGGVPAIPESLNVWTTSAIFAHRSDIIDRLVILSNEGLIGVGRMKMEILREQESLSSPRSVKIPP